MTIRTCGNFLIFENIADRNESAAILIRSGLKGISLTTEGPEFKVFNNLSTAPVANVIELSDEETLEDCLNILEDFFA